MAAKREPSKVKKLITSFLSKKSLKYEEKKDCFQSRITDKDSEGDGSEIGSELCSSEEEPSFIQQNLVVCTDPYDSKAYYDRVETFNIMTWFGKPAELSPLHCARYGWQNTERDLVQCVSCRAVVSGQLPVVWDSNQLYHSCCKKLEDKLKTAHEKACKWIVTPSPGDMHGIGAEDSLSLKIPTLSLNETIQELIILRPLYETFMVVELYNKTTVTERYLTCVQRLCEVKEYLPDISLLSLAEQDVNEEDLNILVNHVRKFINTIQSEGTLYRAVILAACGWDVRSVKGENSVLICNYCRRHIGVWVYREDASSSADNSMITSGINTVDNAQSISGECLNSVITSKCNSSSDLSTDNIGDSVLVVENDSAKDMCKCPYDENDVGSEKTAETEDDKKEDGSVDEKEDDSVDEKEDECVDERNGVSIAVENGHDALTHDAEGLQDSDMGVGDVEEEGEDGSGAATQREEVVKNDDLKYETSDENSQREETDIRSLPYQMDTEPVDDCTLENGIKSVDDELTNGSLNNVDTKEGNKESDIVTGNGVDKQNSETVDDIQQSAQPTETNPACGAIQSISAESSKPTDGNREEVEERQREDGIPQEEAAGMSEDAGLRGSREEDYILKEHTGTLMSKSPSEPPRKRFKPMVKEKLDPLKEHRQWCPWINCYEQSMKYARRSPHERNSTRYDVAMDTSTSSLSESMMEGQLLSDSDVLPWKRQIYIVCPQLRNEEEWEPSLAEAYKQGSPSTLRAIRKLMKDWT